jgi:hypothetical protein
MRPPTIPGDIQEAFQRKEEEKEEGRRKKEKEELTPDNRSMVGWC